MLDINIEDVKNVLISCRPYLIFLGIVLLAAVIALIVCAVNKKLQKKTKYLVRTQAGIVALLAVVITVNMIVTGHTGKSCYGRRKYQSGVDRFFF